MKTVQYRCTIIIYLINLVNFNMATNKNALIRYKILDTCFRNPGKKYFIEDLIEKCADNPLKCIGEISM